MRKSKLSNERRAIDAMYRENFTAFVFAAFSVVNPGTKLIQNWHIECISNHLRKIYLGEAAPRLILNLPPRSLKSFIVSVCFPAWVLGQDPTARFICASYGEDLSKPLSRDCRALMESDFYKRIFPGTRINPKKNTEGEFETTRRGFRLATSVGGTLTGRGGDYILIDDPIKAEAFASEAMLKSANDWFFNTAYSRLDRPATGVFIVTMQRLHVDDLSGILIEKRWPCLAIPAIAECTTEYVLNDDQSHRRMEGDILQPALAAKESLDDSKRTIGSALFAAQYQQNPTPPDGNMIARAWLRYYTAPPAHFSRVVLSCDPAGKPGEHNDFTAITVVGLFKGDVYVLDVVRGHWTILQMSEQILAMKQKWNPDTVLVEETSSGIGLIQNLRERTYLSVIARTPEMGKEDRMNSHQARFEAGKIYLPKESAWLADFLHELLAFPGGRYDDQVDALLLLLDWFVETNAYIGWVGPIIIKTPRSQFDPIYSPLPTPW